MYNTNCRGRKINSVSIGVHLRLIMLVTLVL